MRSYQHDVAWAFADANGAGLMKVKVSWAKASNFSPAAGLRRRIAHGRKLSTPGEDRRASSFRHCRFGGLFRHLRFQILFEFRKHSLVDLQEVAGGDL